NRYALLIGVNEYLWLDPKFRRLEGPGNDVELMRQTLVSQFGFRDDPEHMRVLSDQAGSADPERLPTFATLKRESEEPPARLKPNGQVVLFFAGHGSQQPADWSRKDNYEPDGLDEVFLPRDARFENERWVNGLVDDDLRDWVDRMISPK